MCQGAQSEGLHVWLGGKDLLHLQVWVDTVVEFHEDRAGLPKAERQRSHEIRVSLTWMKPLPGQHLRGGVGRDEYDLVEEGSGGGEPVGRRQDHAVKPSPVARNAVPRRNVAAQNRPVVCEGLGYVRGEPALEHEVVDRVYGD